MKTRPLLALAALLAALSCSSSSSPPSSAGSGGASAPRWECITDAGSYTCGEPAATFYGLSWVGADGAVETCGAASVDAGACSPGTPCTVAVPQAFHAGVCAVGAP